MDLAELERIILDQCKINKLEPLLVGVSGGPDSLCLLHLLKKQEFNVIAAHVNHQLRPEAGQEADLVKAFCALLGVPFIYHQVDAGVFSRDCGYSVEEGARILRYERLMETAEREQAQALAVAHQADDQIETVMMHLMRGSGLSGLKGMSYRSMLPMFSEKIPIVRPLLGVWRKEILEYCSFNNIKAAFDATNLDTTYFRNRIRHELIPLMTTYNDQVPRHLWRLSQIVNVEDDYLNKISMQEYTRIIQFKGAGYVGLNRTAFQQLEIALQRRVSRRILSDLRNNPRDIGSEPINKMVAFASQNKAGRSEQVLDGVAICMLRRDSLLVYTDQADLFHWPLLKMENEFRLKWPAKIDLNPQWSLSLKVRAKDQISFRDDPSTVYFDLAQLQEPLSLSMRRFGEVLAPFGWGGKTIKLGDFFTNEHYPPRLRNHWPILRLGDKILWVVGLRRSDFAPITESTKQVLICHLLRRR